jgi:hypothetical protein
MFTVSLEIPQFRFEVEDQNTVVASMATRALVLVRARALSGEGAWGPFPAPKDVGKPYNRSGQLSRSIGVRWNLGGARPRAFIEPLGDRDDAEDRKAGRNQARLVRQRRLRKRATANYARRYGVTKRDARKLFGRKIFEFSKQALRRLARRNMDVAAILAWPPKDKRARNGQRARYDMFFLRRFELEEVRKIAESTIRVVLATGDGARFEGKAA